MKINRLIFICILITLASCTLKYLPEPPPIEPDKVPDLNITQSFKVINSQRPDSVVDLSVSPYTVKVNLHDYTESVIAVIKDELKKKGISVSENANKPLKLSVVDIWIIPRFGTFKCDLNLTAEIEGGNLIGMEASAQSWNFQKAIDLSVTEAATVILNSEKIIQYLEKQ